MVQGNFVTLQPISKKIAIMEKLPKDPMILFSAVNMLLRDDYKDLDELCDDMQVDRKQLEAKLATAGFEYNPEQNKFW